MVALSSVAILQENVKKPSLLLDSSNAADWLLVWREYLEVNRLFQHVTEASVVLNEAKFQECLKNSTTNVRKLRDMHISQKLSGKKVIEEPELPESEESQQWTMYNSKLNAYNALGVFHKTNKNEL